MHNLAFAQEFSTLLLKGVRKTSKISLNLLKVVQNFLDNRKSRPKVNFSVRNIDHQCKDDAQQNMEFDERKINTFVKFLH